MDGKKGEGGMGRYFAWEKKREGKLDIYNGMKGRGVVGYFKMGRRGWGCIWIFLHGKKLDGRGEGQG